MSTSLLQTESPVSVLANGHILVTWTSTNGQDGDGYGVIGRLFGADGTPLGSEFVVNTQRTNYQSASRNTALSDGGFVVVWHSTGQDGSGVGVYGQRFDANGGKVGSEFHASFDTTLNDQQNPNVVGLAGGGYVVTWRQTEPDGSGWDAYAQRYDASGVPAGGNFALHAGVNTDEQEVIAAALPNGGFLAVWSSSGSPATESQDIIGQIYDASGNPVGAKFKANSFEAPGSAVTSESWPGAAVLADGSFVIVWNSSNHDGSGSGIYGQRFDASGTKIGGEFKAPTYDSGDQTYPSIRALADGGFLVSWTTAAAADGSGSGVFAQRFDAAGTPVGGEFSLAQTTAGNQDVPFIAARADGGFVAAWTTPDANSNGVALRVFSANPQTPVPRTKLVGTALADTIAGSLGGDRFFGRDGNDSLAGVDGDDILYGEGGNDTLDGGAGSDLLVGGAGNDVYIVTDLADQVRELSGEGTDEVRTSLGAFSLGAQVERLTYTGSGSFAGTGNGSANRIIGGGGDDTLNGGGGADTLIAGAGNDLYVVDNTGDIVTELAGEGTDTINASVSFTLGANIENLMLTGSGSVNGTGNALNNVLVGNGGANQLDGGLGDDSMAGGAGNDVYIVDSSGDMVTETFGQGIDEVRTGLSSYLLGADLESLTYVGAGDFSGTGNALDNLLTGGAGADTLSGDAGNDTLNGGLGNDSLIGGLGNDVYFVDSSDDQVIELAGEGLDEVRTGLAVYGLSAGIEVLTYTGTDGFTGTGNELDNWMTGGLGNDTLDGAAGIDSLIGGLGNDVYFVDSLNDQVIELAGEGLDEVRTGLAAYGLSAGVEALTYTGADAFTGTGNELDNWLTGGIGNDTLSGGDGADTLDGGAGSNLLIGGVGSDLYLVRSADDQVVELLGEGIDEIRTALTSYTLADGVETLTYTGTVSFAGIGNALDNLIAGGAGADMLDGGIGADTLLGGLGDDVYVVDSVADTVIEAIDTGIDEVRTTLSAFTLGENVERLVFQGSGDASGLGNGLDNWVAGNIGNDTLDSGAGNDTLLGGLGDDVLTGGSGADLFVFAPGDGQDLITDFDASQGDKIGLAVGQTYTVDTNVNGDALIVCGTTDILTLVGIQPAAVSSAWFITV